MSEPRSNLLRCLSTAIVIASMGCGAQTSTATDAGRDASVLPVDVGDDTKSADDSALDSAPPLHGCEVVGSKTPNPESCACDPGDTWIELDGDGEQQLMKAPYYPVGYAECTRSGPAAHSSGGCGPRSIRGCALGSSCLLLHEPSLRATDWGHYVDRSGHCFSLVDTTLEGSFTSRSGPLVSGRFTATAIGATTLTLRGRFIACEEREIVLCE